MAFNAGKVIEALDWDWNPIVDLKGTVPEPTDDELRKMNSKLKEATTAVTGEDFDPTDRAAVVRAFSKLSDEQIAAMEVQNLDAIEIVTKDSPSRKQLEAAPARLKREFVKWLISELNDPEGAATATST